MKKLFRCFAVILAVMFLATGIKTEAAAGGGVDWTNGSGMITATGVGLPPTNAVGPQKKVWARTAAIADAQRRLAEAANEVKVEGETTVKMSTLVDDTIRTSVAATLKGAQIVSENWNSEGYYEVTMQVPVFGVNGLARAVIPEPTTPPAPFPAPEVIPSQGAESQTGDSVSYTSVGGENLARGGYTGLIIDCRGLGLNPVMSPVIKNSKGVKLYGHENLNYDLVIRDGMASYANSQSQASRAGSKPLILKAERLDDHNANPVVSVNDGNKILIENGSSGFLNKTAVVFLY